MATANVLSKGSLFPPELVSGMINQVKGKSTIAGLSDQTPIAFTGQTEFIFNLDNEVGIVAENGKKPAQAASIKPITIQPIKVVYTMRTSEEFMFAGDEYQLGVLQAFGEGFAKKLAKGLDLMAIHGLNPFSDSASSIIGNNCFDKAGIGTTTGTGDIDSLVEEAIGMVQDAEYDVTGIAMSPATRSALAKLTNKNGERIYPELSWGSAPSTINGLPVQIAATVGHKGTDATKTDKFIVGDFANSFRWGYAKNMPIEVIEYGDPDNAGVDLKGSNQIAIRGEAYLGWAIFDTAAFAMAQA